MLLAVCLGLFAGCATDSKSSFTGPYLGYEETRVVRVDEDQDFSSKRPPYLMKYWTLSAVKIADESILNISSEKRLFAAQKEGFLYFSVAYPYEHYAWSPSPQEPKLITTTAKYWVYGLDRYKTQVVNSEKKKPNPKCDGCRLGGRGRRKTISPDVARRHQECNPD